MNLRCIYCQTPFSLSRSEMLAAIINMNEKNMNHYDAHCPRCRRANSISRQRMELFYPNWQEVAKQEAAKPAVPPPVPASASLKTEPLPKALKAKETSKKPRTRAGKAKEIVASKPAAKKPAAKKPAAKKPAAKKPIAKKTTTTKSTAKKSTAKGKKK